MHDGSEGEGYAAGVGMLRALAKVIERMPSDMAVENDECLVG
jgi:hypothetical protein